MRCERGYIIKFTGSLTTLSNQQYNINKKMSEVGMSELYRSSCIIIYCPGTAQGSSHRETDTRCLSNSEQL